MIKRLKQKIDGKFTNGKVIYQGALELYSMRKKYNKVTGWIGRFRSELELSLYEGDY